MALQKKNYRNSEYSKEFLQKLFLKDWNAYHKSNPQLTDEEKKILADLKAEGKTMYTMTHGIEGFSPDKTG